MPDHNLDMIRLSEAPVATFAQQLFEWLPAPHGHPWQRSGGKACGPRTF